MILVLGVELLVEQVYQRLLVRGSFENQLAPLDLLGRFIEEGDGLGVLEAGPFARFNDCAREDDLLLPDRLRPVAPAALGDQELLAVDSA